MVGKAFHTGASACVWHVYFRIQKYSFGHMAVCREIVYHGTESKKYMCIPQGRNFRNEKQEDGGK